MDYLQLAKDYATDLRGRYITMEHIYPILKSFNGSLKQIGKSVNHQPIYSYKIGQGSKRIVLWSQMHGNESTTTKGLIDFLCFLNEPSSIQQAILTKYTLYIIPILNVDGAKSYTRNNANGIDLNRDAFSISQPESQLLRTFILDHSPNLCFNLHDQRTIFATDRLYKPATMSFLAPSYNSQRSFNSTRLKAVKTILNIQQVLKNYLPDQIGRYDDRFNINCIGDYLMNQGYPTILFEAGHFLNDYQRDTVRYFVFISLITSLKERHLFNDRQLLLNIYDEIPNNISYFYDIIYKNVKINVQNEEKIIKFAAQFEEKLVNDLVHFDAKIVKNSDLENNKGHLEYDFEGAKYFSNYGEYPKIGQIADFSLKKVNKI